MDHKGRIHRNRTHETKRRDVSLVPFFLLGLVLPIDTMGGVPPVLFDVLRYGLALVIVVASLSRPRESRPNPLLGWVTFLLTTAGALAIAKAVFLGGSCLQGSWRLSHLWWPSWWSGGWRTNAGSCSGLWPVAPSAPSTSSSKPTGCRIWVSQ